MEVNRIRVKLTNLFCDKSVEGYASEADEILDDIRNLDHIMMKYYGQKFNAEAIDYE